MVLMMKNARFCLLPFHFYYHHTFLRRTSLAFTQRSTGLSCLHSHFQSRIFCSHTNGKKVLVKEIIDDDQINKQDTENLRYKTYYIYLGDDDNNNNNNNNNNQAPRIYYDEDKRNALKVGLTAKIKQFFVTCFLPNGYPYTVSKDYLTYQKWAFLQNVVGSASYVLSTQALLYSVGVGTGTALPASAAISWLLRDGLGSIGLVFFTGKFSSHFDSDIKAARWKGDTLHILGVGLEVLTPLFPAYFLLVGSLANLAKAIAGLVMGSTRANINRHFSLAENMSDVTAKFQAQSLAGYMCGMALGMGLTLTLPVGWGVVGSFCAYSCLSAVYLFASYKALSSLTLSILNTPRTSSILKSWFESKEIPTPEELQREDKIIRPWGEPFSTWMKKPIKKTGDFQIILGVSISEAYESQHDLTLHSHCNDIFHHLPYMINLRDGILWGILTKEIDSINILKSFFHAYSISYKMKKQSKEKLDDSFQKETLQFVEKEFPIFVEKLNEKKWNTQNVLIDLQNKRALWGNSLAEGTVK